MEKLFKNEDEKQEWITFFLSGYNEIIKILEKHTSPITMASIHRELLPIIAGISVQSKLGNIKNSNDAERAILTFKFLDEVEKFLKLK